MLGEEVLEKFVDGPGDGSGGHLVDDAGVHALEVAGQAIELVYRPEGVGHAREPAVDVGQAEGHVLLSVEKGLTDVQGGGGGRGQGPGQPAREDVGLWVVAPVGVDLFLQELVGDEVDGLEGNVHGQLRGIAPVEGPQALSPPNRPDAAEGRPVWRVVHLHALFHNFCRVHYCIVEQGGHTPSYPCKTNSRKLPSGTRCSEKVPGA